MPHLSLATSTMYSFSFPTEIWLGIAIYLNCKEYLSLVLVSRDFYQIFIASLYSNLIMRFPTGFNHYAENLDGLGDTDPAIFAPAGPKLGPFLERLNTHPSLRTYVRSVHIKNLIIIRGKADPNQPLHDRFGWAVINLLGSFPLLQKVEFTDVDMYTECLLGIASHLTQQLDIYITNGILYGAPLSSRKVTARALSLCGRIAWPFSMEGIRQFLSASSMRKLDISPLSWHIFYGTYASGGNHQLSHLESLTIPYIDLEELDIFSAMTNLRELIFSGQSQVWHVGVGEIPPGNGTAGVLKNLKVISTHNRLVFPFTAGRRIEEIGAFDTPAANIDLADFGARFGSEVMVKKVEWRHCRRVDMVVDYITAKNTGVWHLTIEASQAAGEIEAASQATLMLYLSKIVQLRELRTLRLTTLTQAPTRRSLAWEEEQCRYLRRAGCPLLVSVAFREQLTWTRHPGDETLWRPSGAWAGIWRY